jgi:hypothetical protein
MRAVAERLVLRRSAAANGHVVASFILMTIRRGQRHAAAQPDRAAAVLRRILDQSDRERRIRFDGLARSLVEGKQPPGRAIVDLAQEHRPHVGIVGARDLRPDLAVRVAKARVGAQVPHVQQRKIGTVENPRLRRKGGARRRFGPVKADFRMGAVAKWRLADWPQRQSAYLAGASKARPRCHSTDSPSALAPTISSVSGASPETT